MVLICKSWLPKLPSTVPPLPLKAPPLQRRQERIRTGFKMLLCTDACKAPWMLCQMTL